MKVIWISAFFLFLLLSFSRVYAQTESVITMPPSPTPIKEVVYDMPYPGLLPDNPFYIIKTARDRIVGFLISDPLKKATFDLLQSDKRFQAGVMLYQKDATKRDLAMSTISKGINYLDEAITKTDDAKKQKVETADLSRKIHLSIQKQQQILLSLEKSDKTLIEKSSVLRERLVDLQKKADKIIPIKGAK